MSEEEKKAIETLKGLTVYYDDYSLLDEEEIEENDNINKSIQLMIDLIERLEKELNSLKEIEQLHQEENGKLRVELEQEKEKNKDLEEKLKIAVAMLTKGTYPEKNEGDNDFDKKFIAVDKIRKIVDEHIPKQPNIITGEMEYTPNTNANSFLVQDILKLLEEK